MNAATTARTQTSGAAEIPAWVPPEYREVYQLVATAKGEEEAASIARHLKRSERADPVWTPGAIITLVHMSLIGEPSSKIAAALGEGVTRNAVIGKRTRLGLTSDRPRPKASAPAKAPTRPLRVVSKAPAPERLPPTPIAQVIVPEDPVAPPVEGGLDLNDLEHHHCRFPLPGRDRAPYRYCGARKGVGQPAFCDAHAARAYAGRSPVSKKILKAMQR